jgi:peptidyl-prolyl cis-trans isomerase B (cyclophilin B)
VNRQPSRTAASALPSILGSLASALMAAAPAAGQTGAETPGLGVTLRIEGLYHGVDRTIRAAVDGGGDQTFQVLLLDANGAERGRTDVMAGTDFDLLERLPALRGAPVAHWIQLVRGDEPIGSAWVAQPLVNRPLVRTARALRPDGKTEYTRIIGWGDRLLEETPEYLLLKDAWPRGEPIVWSGLRIYPERDVLLRTDAGEIRVALAPDRAPNTAWNFRSLVADGFYDGTPFHRIVKFDREGRPFVIQGGDPTGTGDGSAGYDLPLEPSDLQHDFGVISMARSDPPDSAGSQFFFCLSREGTARLDWQYCAFGWAVDGAETILRIADAEIEDLTTGRPKVLPRVIEAELVPAPPRVPGRGRPDRRVQPAAAIRRDLPKQPDR